MMVSLLVSNVPELAFTHYAGDLPFRRELCAGMFLFGMIMGCVALLRHGSRSRTPWKIPQSTVALPYSFFFISTLFAVLLTK